MEQNLCCAIIGQPPMRFPWGFDEEDEGCNALKLALAQKIMELRQQGVTRFAVVADYGIGLYFIKSRRLSRMCSNSLMPAVSR